ncbi:ClpP/crotonase, partial [Gloeophyllum trabeum ATCC 11539]
DVILFESHLSSRTYILNRDKKLNALDQTMLDVLRPKIEEWASADLCKLVIGRGNGRAFCAGGDVASVVTQAANPSTRPRAIEFFKREFELDYLLAALGKPYVAVMDGI